MQNNRRNRSFEVLGISSSAKIHVSSEDSLDDSKLNKCTNILKKGCNKKLLLKRAPILSWLPKYDREKAVSDLIAGLTVGLTVIPQGIAYAIIAKLPAQYGLYSAFMGCFMYLIFGSSKDITVGPTAIMALLTAQYAPKDLTGHSEPAFVVLLAFLSGLIIISMGLLQLGFVIDFISVPVTAGFTSAAALTIACGQVKSLFGLHIEHHEHIEGVHGRWIEWYKNFHTARLNDSILGISCCIILLSMRALGRNNWFVETPNNSLEETKCQSLCSKQSEKTRKFLKTTCWVIATARNAIIVILCTLLAYFLDPEIPKNKRDATFILTGNIDDGLPPFQIPAFSFNDTSSTASGDIIDFKGMISGLGPAIVILPLIAILENVAIAKAFSAGKPVDASQEMIALGICNVMGSFVSSMPTTGSFSRTAVNSVSGVKTTFGGIYTGGLVILALAVLMPLCAYIPKATLSAVIITAVIFSVEYHVVRPMWKSKKSDLIPAFATFFGCLFLGLEYGILIGVGIQVLIILYQSARPSLNVEVCEDEDTHLNFLHVTLDRGLMFPAVSHVRHLINKAGMKEGQCKLPLVLDCTHLSTSDFTVAEGFKSMIKDFDKRNQSIIFYKPATPVLATLKIKSLNVVQSKEELKTHFAQMLA